MSQIFDNIDKAGLPEVLALIAILYGFMITILFISVCKENIRLHKKTDTKSIG